MSNNFRSGFMTALGVMAAVAAVPATIWVGYLLWGKGMDLLRSPAYDQWFKCWQETVFDKNDPSDPLHLDPAARVDRDCGASPPRWRWQTR